MCFEFEALYWAKIAEEELKKQKEQKQKEQAVPAKNQKPTPQPMDEPVPV